MTPGSLGSGQDDAGDPSGARVDYGRLFALDGRRAMVIGGGSGIGQAASWALAAHGAQVVAADRDLAAAQATAAGFDAGAAAGAGSVTACELDVLDADAVRAVAGELDDVEVLVLTAATNVRKRVLDYSVEEFERVVALNLRGAFTAVQAFAPSMVRRGRGSIIGFSSIRASVVEPGQGVYAATKAGLVQLLRTVAAELGPSGVRANAIAPGVVETPLTAQIKADPGWYDAYASKAALGRWARPHEMAGAVVYLAGDAASFVTGSVLTVDGGWTAVDGRFDPPT